MKVSITPAAAEALVNGDLANFLTAATPGGIEAQEAAGQRSLCASINMPKDMQEGRAVYERLGFVFGAPVDDIFLGAILPAGWSRKPTEHSMWSMIMDEKGRERVSIFYKAAFYDRSAFCRLTRRFSVVTLYGERAKQYGASDGECVVTIDDGGQVVQQRPPMPERPYEDVELARAAMRAALLAKYPLADSVEAYWD